MPAKDAILKLLEDNKGTILSGNDIASALNITRAAVWKAIQILRQNGYLISAVNKKGYCLQAENDILSPQSILPYLKNKELYPSIFVHKLLSSTNTEAKQLAENGSMDGTVVIAEQQSQGKGRLGRSFYSPTSNGIYMSVIMRPQNTIEQSLLITSAAAVAVCRGVKTVCGLDCQIKWVNDVYLDGKKICGILTEASMNFEAQQLAYMVVGIGVNVSTCDFPPELKEVATSLKEKLAGKSVSRSHLIGEILNELSAITRDLSDKSFLKEYKALSFILGSQIDIISVNGRERATALDINEQGHLVVRLEDGEIRVLTSGEVSIRKVTD